MRIYFTSEPYEKLRSVFNGLKNFKIINVSSIAEDLNVDLSDDVQCYLLNEEVRRILTDYMSAKRVNGIIYINKHLDISILSEVQHAAERKMSKENIDYIVVDDYDVPKHEDIYKNVGEVIFTPMHKKVKILDCKPIKFIKKNK